MIVEVVSVDVVAVVVAKLVVEVTIVDVESVVTMTGWWVIVTTAKYPAPGGLKKSLYISFSVGYRLAYQCIDTFCHKTGGCGDRILNGHQYIIWEHTGSGVRSTRADQGGRIRI